MNAGGMTATLRAERLFTGETVLAPGYLTIDGAYVAALGSEPPAGSRVVDLGDADLLPGLVDLHSDCWHHRANPRPTTRFALDDSFIMLDVEVVSWGITTHFVCVALQDDATTGRTVKQAMQSARIVDKLGGQLRADHRVHLRVEATSERVDVAADLAGLTCVSLLSYMDHTPGQGQFRREADWRAYYASMGESNLDAMLAHRQARRPFIDEVRVELARICHRHGIPLASHDDDTIAAVDRARQLGVRICEFPVTAQAAAAATEQGLLTVMGAPNALLGTSHLTGNLSARSALGAGYLGALASDYHLPSLLNAVYALAADGVCDLTTAVALVTSGPAWGAGMDDRGVLAPGRRADLVAVRLVAGRPVVGQTWVAGTPVLGS
jgi:alpha-D-ribose 1-methylphosphonate 5-triphosphate diphosphatase